MSQTHIKTQIDPFIALNNDPDYKPKTANFNKIKDYVDVR
jgi:hypothetical protein